MASSYLLIKTVGPDVQIHAQVNGKALALGYLLVGLLVVAYKLHRHFVTRNGNE